MKPDWLGWSELPVRRPRLALALAGAATAVLLAGLGRLQIDSSLEAMAVQGDPLHAAHERHKEVFGSDEILSIALPFEDALAPQALALQRRLALAIESVRTVEEVESLATVDDVAGDGDALDIAPLVPEGDPAALLPEEIEAIRARVARNPLLPGWLVSRDGRTAALQVRFDYASSEPERNAALAAIDTLLRQELGARPYHLAGHLFMKSEIAHTITRDLQLLLPATIAVMALLLVVAMRCWVSALASLGGVLLAVAWMLGAMGWAGIPLTALSNAAPTILLAVGTAYVLHVAAAAQRHAASGAGPAEAATHALRHVRFGMVGAGLTTLVGYASLTLSQVPVVNGFGWALVLGIVAVMAIGLFVLPAVFALWATRPAQSLLGPDPRLGRVLLGLARLAVRHARAVLAAAIGVAGLAALTLPLLRVDSSGPNRFPEDSRFRRSSEFYRAQLSGDVVEGVYLSGPREHFYEPEVLRRIQAFQRDAEALPEIDESVSIADYVALMNREMEGGADEALRIPDSREAVAQYLFLYGASGDPGELDELVDPDAGRARIVLAATVPSSTASAVLRARLEELAERHLAAETGPDAVVSTEILLSRAADVVVQEQVRGFAWALALILVMVAASFRSLGAGLHLLLPNGLPLLLNLAVMALLGIPLGDATAIISATCLGIAVDSTIHTMAETRSAERRCGSRHAAVAHALLTVGRPIVVTGILIIAGFSMLLLSDFRSVRELGFFTALTMVFCLIGDTVVAPSQLCAAGGAEDPRARPVVVGAGRLLAAALLRECPGGRPALEWVDPELAQAPPAPGGELVFHALEAGDAPGWVAAGSAEEGA